MWPVFKIFWNAEGTKPILVLLCLMLGGFAEALGIGMMLPVLGTILGEQGSASSLIQTFTQGALGILGLAPSIGNMLLLLLVIMAFRSIILFSTMTFAGVTGARVAINLRRRLMRALFNARWSYYTRLSSGRIANSLGNDAQNAGYAYTLSASATTMFMQIIGYTAVALVINWRVALCALAAGLLMALISRHLITLSRKAGFKQVDRVAAFTADTTGMLQNIKALKAMDRFETPIDNLATLLRKLKRTLYTQNIVKFALSYGNDLLIALIVCTGAWIALTFAKMPAAELLVFGVLFFQVVSYVTKFLKHLQAAAVSQAGYDRTMELISETTREAEVNTGQFPPTLADGCHFKNVSFAHGDKPIIHNASFTIPAGKITVLEGPSGSGKTTLIDLLIGLHQPNSGDILIGNDRIADVDIKKWRQKIGYVPQELMLFHDDIKNNITLYDVAVDDKAVASAMDMAGVTSFMHALSDGMDTDVGEWGSKLSGGQRQRIALARALVRNPEILVLDEVTSALDPETETAIVDNIAKLNGKFTVIVITHRPAWTRIADNLLQVENGKVTSLGSQKSRKS